MVDVEIFVKIFLSILLRSLVYADYVNIYANWWNMGS